MICLLRRCSSCSVVSSAIWCPPFGNRSSLDEQLPYRLSDRLATLDNTGHRDPLELCLSALQFHHRLGCPSPTRFDRRHAFTALDVNPCHVHHDQQRHHHGAFDPLVDERARKFLVLPAIEFTAVLLWPKSTPLFVMKRDAVKGTLVTHRAHPSPIDKAVPWPALAAGDDPVQLGIAEFESYHLFIVGNDRHPLAPFLRLGSRLFQDLNLAIDTQNLSHLLLKLGVPS